MRRMKGKQIIALTPCAVPFMMWFLLLALSNDEVESFATNEGIKMHLFQLLKWVNVEDQNTDVV